MKPPVVDTIQTDATAMLFDVNVIVALGLKPEPVIVTVPPAVVKVVGETISVGVPIGGGVDVPVTIVRYAFAFMPA